MRPLKHRAAGYRRALLGDLFKDPVTQIPKLGKRPRPRRRARPRFIGLLRREKNRSSWQLFYSLGVAVRYLNSLERTRTRVLSWSVKFFEEIYSQLLRGA